MIKYLFVALSFFVTCSCISQDTKIVEIAKQASKSSLEKNLYSLASDKMEGRLMGSRGDSIASIFIADWFKQHNLKAPFENGKSYIQPITVYRKKVTEAKLTITGKTYEELDGWLFPLNSTESVQLNNIPVVFAGYGITDSRYDDLAAVDVKGKAVILLTGQPVDTAKKYLLTGTDKPATIGSYEKILKEKGASLVLIYNKAFQSIAAVLKRNSFPVYKSGAIRPLSLPIFQLSAERINELLAADNITVAELESKISKTSSPQSFVLKNTLSVQLNISIAEEHAPNVIGVIPGTDPSANAVVISAHHDHNGKHGNDIYYGAVDNASGTSAIMEVAALFQQASKKGLKPKRNIVFASYTGEERGLLGSYYYAEHPVYPLEKTWAVINIDMMGRVDTFYSGKRADSNYAYILVKDTLGRGLRNSLLKANESLGSLKLDTWYEQPQYMQRRLQGSDQYPLYLKGVPFLRIDCGFSKDYHQLTDTPDKINYDLLTKQTQLAFLTLWNLANE